MPKPTATCYGLRRERLMFFETPKTRDLRVKNDSGKIARIRVEGGVMKTEKVLHELQWLLPGNQQWNVSVVDNNIFKVVLSSKTDLARLQKIKMIEVEDTTFTMHFE